MPSRAIKYPLSQQLTSLFLRSKTPRTDIISPRLCDDAIQRLAPSLAPYVGCTIIDISPGVGLWSAKLHEFLRPRRHVLVERDKTYLHFLQPLLDAPGSRYKYFNWNGEMVRHPTAYLKHGVIPSVEEAKAEGSLILIVANIAGEKALGFNMEYGSRAHIRALDFAHSAREGGGFHAYGATRMLMWATDGERRALLPKTVGYRHKVAMFLEASFHVEEVVGGRDNNTSIHREDALELESHRRVVERMATENVVVPPDRQVGLYDSLSNFSKTSRSWHREFEILDEGFKNQKLPQFIGLPPGPLIGLGRAGAKVRGHAVETPQYTRWRHLRSTIKSENNKIEKANQHLRKQEEIDQLDLEAHRDGIDSEKQAELITVLDAKIKEYNDALSNLSEKDRYRIMFTDDDRRAFRMDPPLLMWDRRKAEPLLTQVDEFWPSRAEGLALIDFQTILPQPLSMTPEQSSYFTMLGTELLSHTGPVGVRFLNKMAPGAYEALAPKVPALEDPRKGGRRGPDNTRSRTLTPEMLHGLAIAWDRWLFKPPYLSDTMPQSSTQALEMRRGARGKVG